MESQRVDIWEKMLKTETTREIHSNSQKEKNQNIDNLQ